MGTTLSSSVNTSVSAANQSLANVAQIVRSSNVNVVTTVSSGQLNSNSSLNAANNLNSIGNASGPQVLPIAKVLPQQHSIGNEGLTPSIVSVSTTASGQSVFIHSRSPSNALVTPIVATNHSTANIHLPSNSQNTVSFISSASGAYYVPATVHSNSNNSNINATAVSNVHHTTNTSSVSANAIPSISTSQIITSAPVTSIAYAPQAGSFAVVPASNRKSGPQHGKGKARFIFYSIIIATNGNISLRMGIFAPRIT